MPDRTARKRAEKKKREGKATSTQAGEFVREEMHHMKRGKHRVKNRKQAIAIGLSKARRSGVKVWPKKSTAAGSKQKGARRGTGARRKTTSRS